MGGSGPRWAVVDELVHDLGSLRALVEEVEAQPEFSQDEVALQLRSSLARAADTIHLVIGGDEAMLAQARRTIAEAQEVAARVRSAIAGAGATQHDAGVIRKQALARGGQTRRHVQDLHALQDRNRPRAPGGSESRKN